MLDNSKSRGTRGHGRPVKKRPAVTQTSVPVQPSIPTPVNSSPPPSPSVSHSSPRPSASSGPSTSHSSPRPSASSGHSAPNSSPHPSASSGPSASHSLPRPSRPSTMPAVRTGLHMPGKLAIGVVTGAMVAGGAYYMYKRRKAKS